MRRRVVAGAAVPGAAAALVAAGLAAAAVGPGPGAAHAPSGRGAPVHRAARPPIAAPDTLLVGVLARVDTATVFSDGPTRLVDPATGEVRARARPYEPWHFLVAGGGATAWGSWGALERSAARLRVVPADPSARVFLDGRPHRGQAEVVHLPGGTLTVASRVEREGYLWSVVASELGDEGLAAFEAAKAQAVAARSYAVAAAASGRRDSLGVDLLADPEEDQSYPGVLAERDAARRAVAETRGRILAWRGEPATAFFHSTCGGRTVRPEEAWPERRDRPYLRSLSDSPEVDGEAFCAVSPRFRWRRAWTAEEVAGTVVPAAARVAGLDPRALSGLREVAVTARSEHGRALELAMVVGTTDPGPAAGSGSGGGADAATAAPGRAPGPGAAEGPASGHGAPTLDTLRFGPRRIPRALPSPDGEPLLSTWFEVAEPGEGEALAVEGRGSGHGVGMCQWGAVARAREGAGWREILAAYYPGTEVTRIP